MMDSDCPICAGKLTDPRELPCSEKHIFCLSCLKGLRECSESGFICPLCRSPIVLGGKPIESLKKVYVKVSVYDDLYDKIDKEINSLDGVFSTDIKALDNHLAYLEFTIRGKRDLIKEKINEYYEEKLSKLKDFMEITERNREQEANKSNEESKEKANDLNTNLEGILQNNSSTSLHLKLIDHVEFAQAIEINNVEEEIEIDYDIEKVIGNDYGIYGKSTDKVIKLDDNPITSIDEELDFDIQVSSSNFESLLIRHKEQSHEIVKLQQGENREEMGKIITPSNFKQFFENSNDCTGITCFRKKDTLVLYSSYNDRLVSLGKCLKNLGILDAFVYNKRLYVLSNDSKIYRYRIREIFKSRSSIEEKITVEKITDINFPNRQMINDLRLNNRFILRDNDYIYIIYGEDKTATAYPIKTILGEGKLVGFAHLQDKIKFLLLKEDGKKLVTKFYDL